MTTGETANGRLMIASITGFAFDLRRTRSSAQPTPKIVLSGTAITTISSVSFSACRPSGEVIASSGGSDPVFEGLVEDHHQRDQQQHRQVAEPEHSQAPAAGGIRRPSDATSVAADVLAAMASGMNSLELRSWRIAQRWINETAASSKSEATSRTTETAEAPISLPDSIWLRMKTEETVVSGNPPAKRRTSQLAQRAGESEGDAGGEARKENGKDDAAEDREVAGPERGGGGLHLTVHLQQQRLHGADDEGKGDDISATTTASESPPGKIPSGLSLPYSVSRVRLATIVGRAKGRSITALTALCREVVADQQPGEDRAEDPIDHDDDQRADDRSFRLFSASGEVTWSQKAPRPPAKASLTTAASGSSTMMLR